MEDYQVQILTTFLAFVAGWGLSLVNDRRHKKSNLKDAYISLVHELKEQKEFLDNRTKKIVIIEDDKNYEISSLYIGISRYESLIYSGMFRQLDYDVQDLAVKVYGKIKHLNKGSELIVETSIKKMDNSSKEFLRILRNLGELKEKEMKVIKIEIPKLIKLIEERMSTSLF